MAFFFGFLHSIYQTVASVSQDIEHFEQAVERGQNMQY